MFVRERVISAYLLSCLLTSPTVLPEPSLGRGLPQLAEAARGAWRWHPTLLKYAVESLFLGALLQGLPRSAFLFCLLGAPLAES